MDSNYWVNFWKTYTSDLKNKDEQTQVLRTLNKLPISQELWEFTLQNIDSSFEVKKEDKVLDLCCGNGILSKHFADKGAYITSIDISEELLKGLNNYNNIITIHSDITKVTFKDNSFDKIIIYAGIQYFSRKEVVELVVKIYRWLKPNGVLFIGDIPDHRKLWSFYNNKERQNIYFENLLENKSIVGNWFEKEWFQNLGNYSGFNQSIYLPQDKKLIYSNFRFDFLFKK